VLDAIRMLHKLEEERRSTACSTSVGRRRSSSSLCSMRIASSTSWKFLFDPADVGRYVIVSSKGLFFR